MRYGARLAWVTAYVLLSLAWIYGVLNPDRSDEAGGTSSFWYSTSGLLIVGAVVAATGLVIPRWWTPTLAFLPAVLAVPAGYEADGSPEVPIWFLLGAWGIVFGVPLMAGGVAARWLIELAARRRAGFPQT